VLQVCVCVCVTSTFWQRARTEIRRDEMPERRAYP
jgi:hypothetical protein